MYPLSFFDWQRRLPVSKPLVTDGGKKKSHVTVKRSVSKTNKRTKKKKKGPATSELYNFTIVNNLLLRSIIHRAGRFELINRNLGPGQRDGPRMT